jgi:hypothetical protein
LLPLTGLLPATALLAASAALLLLLIALNGHLITPCLARGITLRLDQTFRRYSVCTVIGRLLMTTNGGTALGRCAFISMG